MANDNLKFRNEHLTCKQYQLCYNHHTKKSLKLKSMHITKKLGDILISIHNGKLSPAERISLFF